MMTVRPRWTRGGLLSGALGRHALLAPIGRQSAVGDLRTQAHLPEDPLTLAYAQLDVEVALEVLREADAVPHLGTEAEILRALLQMALQLLPLRRIERARPAGPPALPQGLQSAFLETMDPALYRRFVLAEELCHFPAGVPGGQQQQPMQPVIVSGLLAAPDFLLDGNPHGAAIVDLEFAHRSSTGSRRSVARCARDCFGADRSVRPNPSVERRRRLTMATCARAI